MGYVRLLAPMVVTTVAAVIFGLSGWDLTGREALELGVLTFLLNLFVGLGGFSIQAYFLEQSARPGWQPAEERETRAFLESKAIVLMTPWSLLSVLLAACAYRANMD